MKTKELRKAKKTRKMKRNLTRSTREMVVKNRKKTANQALQLMLQK